MADILVKMTGIEKSFPGVRALDGCQFDLQKGEVHALMGENGAGKSTLMKVLTGVYIADAGTIEMNGQQVKIGNPKAAQMLGINIIHQELNLCQHLTVAQNIFIGREVMNGLFLNKGKMEREAQELLKSLNLDIDAGDRVANLSVAKQQMVEIAKALSIKCEVLIMDEPTAALTDSEIEELFRMIANLKAQGVGIVYISHRMDEIKRISDRVTVMRDGKYIKTLDAESATIEDIIALMVGREIYSKGKPEVGDAQAPVVLEVKHLKRGRTIKDVSFQLKKGEILGFAGLMGAGRTETARAIFGADPIDGGEIYKNGKLVKINSPKDAVRHGIGYLSEDRKRFGLALGLDVATNTVLASVDEYSKWGFIQRKKVYVQAQKMVDAMSTKTPNLAQRVRNLSGGNQQKVIIGKWLTRDCDVLIFDEPTRGIDVGAKGDIYRLLNDLAKQGKSIIMISSELEEVLRMSHRICVMCEGRLTGILTAEEASQEHIMKFATMREKTVGGA